MMIPIKVLFQASMKIYHTVKYGSSFFFLPLRIWNFKDSQRARYSNTVWPLKLSMYTSLILPMVLPFLLATARNALGKHVTLCLYESREGRHIKVVHYSILNKLSCPVSLQWAETARGQREKRSTRMWRNRGWLRNLICIVQAPLGCGEV